MDVTDNYRWEVETKNGTIYETGNDYNFDEVVRISLIPRFNILPRHDIIFSNFKLVKRFCRAFLAHRTGMREYLHCIITNQFRVYIKSSNGQVIITPQDYELYI